MVTKWFSFARKPKAALALAILVLVGAARAVVVTAKIADGYASAASQPLPGYQEALLPASTLAGVVPGPGGLLYGVTYEGGLNNLGTIFSATPDLSSVTVLHSFNGTDGRIPYSELTASGSILYGTTSSGGPSGGGTVFSFNPSNGNLTTLASFGFPYTRPVGPLLLLGEYLYGSTSSFPGGSSVFRLRTDGTAPPQFLHFFAATDGYGPGALTLGPGGYLYGTAAVGGLPGCYPDPYSGCGTIFRLRPDGLGPGQSDFSVVYTFDSATVRGRGFPERKLVIGSDGRLYGTTYTGVFSLTPNSVAPDFQVLYAVPRELGSQIFAPPIEGLDGRLYINQYDGSDGLTNSVGSIYSMTKAGTDVITHHLFTLSGGGQGPYGVMYQDPGGAIFGTTEYSNVGPGTLFVIRSLTSTNLSQTTLASSLNPSAPGQAVTFTATVTPAGASGSVSFSADGVQLGAAVPLVAGSASVTTSTLALGSHSITATYGGGGSYQGSSAQLTQLVVLPTTTIIESSPNPSTVGQSVTFTATVTGGANPSGTVVFRDGVVQIGVAPLVNGIATVSAAFLTSGTHPITAQYGGNSQNAESTSTPLAQVVNKVSTSVGLFSSLNPSKIGNSVTFTATLPNDADGVIAFLDGAMELTSVAVVGGQAQMTTAALTIGAHPIVARYNGNAKYLAVDSATLTQTVNPLNSPPQIAPIADQTLRWDQLLALPVFATDVDGDPITFSLVNPPPSASITPAGQFAWTPTSAQVGTTTITVEASDGALSSSRSFTVTVQKHVTSVNYLQPFAAAPGSVELQANLFDTTSGAPLAGRTIAFTLGTQTANGVTDATGLARGSLMLAQPSGNIPVSAAFAGDAAYLSSGTAPQPFRVSAPPVFAPVPNQQVFWGRTLTVPFQVSDPDGDAITLVVVSAPQGLLQNPNTLVWTPSVAQVGSASVTLRASDGVSTTFLTVAIEVLRHPTTIVDLAPAAAVGNGPLVVKATLRDAEFATHVGGKTLTFTIGNQSVAGVTNPWEGAAAGTIVLNLPLGPATLEAAFAGDAAYAPSTTTRALTIFSDVDGDGLRDDWEINGIDADGNGSIDLDLPAMGANPLRKDLFVETDWMELARVCLVAACVPGDALEPQAAAVQGLIAAFAAAPVPNPDGSSGITLHLDAGPASMMNPLTGQLWGALARGGRVPFDYELGTVDANFVYDWSEFDALKQAHFDAARRGVFRYVIYGHTLGDPFASGLARDIAASDVAIAAGSSTWAFGNGFSGMTVAQERGLLLHELGHTLGLRHGGGDDFNNKPNYSSVLNYLYVFVGLPPDGRSDYSRVEEPSVDIVLADGSVRTLFGFNDWPALVYSGGGIGDRAAFPAPRRTPIEVFDPVELRARNAWARAGDGIAKFRGPALLIRNSGVRNLIVDVRNVSNTSAQYVVSIETGSPAVLQSGVLSIAPGQVVRAAIPIDTTGLPAGEHEVMVTLRSTAGQVLHQSRQQISVLDLADPASAERARETAAALAQLPPDSGFDAEVVAQILDMIGDVLGPLSWQAVVTVTGGTVFSATYLIEQPHIGADFVGEIHAQSIAGEPEFDLDLHRAGAVATGRVRVKLPAGSIVEVPVNGRWNAATSTFEGKWHMSKQQQGVVAIQLRRP